VHQPSSQQWPLVPPPLSQQQQLAAFPELPDVQQCALCEVLGVSPGDAQLLLLTCAAASSMSRAQLTESWRQLQQQLPVPPPQLLQALLQVPELLPQPQQTLRARLAAAAGTLGVPPARLVCPHASRTAELHWRLLVTPHERLVRQLEQLVRLLGSGLPERRVAALVCAEPQLLTVDAAALLSTIEALEQVRRARGGCPSRALATQQRQCCSCVAALGGHHQTPTPLCGLPHLSRCATARCRGCGLAFCSVPGCWCVLQASCTRRLRGCSSCCG
jgi:hypothetical protein